MNKLRFLLVFWLAGLTAFAQMPDSTALHKLQEVQVTGYLSRQPLLTTPASAAVLNAAQLQQQAQETLLPALNALPGVRMEERSPGSYRLSLRGSLLRSPFGVRNVKVYADEFPLTDAGGNTYLNLIDPKSISRIEILKGPDGSLFGANSGGVVLLSLTPELPKEREVSFDLSGGSYSMLHENLGLQKRFGASRLIIKQGFQRSDGYRENSALRRHYFQATELWQYAAKNHLKLFAFYSDLKYETPGGLTLAQFEANPKQARPAAGPNPGAAEQQARIENKTGFAGITHEAGLTGRVRHVASVFGSVTSFKNPFITNYETRKENNVGLRTYLEVSSPENLRFNWKWNTGLEWQHGEQEIANYTNNRGVKGELQAADKLSAGQYFYFTRFSSALFEKLTAEAAVSLNYYRFGFEKSAAAPAGERTFNPEWMPRLGVSYRLLPDLAWRASLSRGYSPPTIAEIRPSGIVINPDLKAETGWNQETGFRYSHAKNRFEADISIYNYRLQEAIVRRSGENGEEFFTNAGGTNQKGIEALIMGWVLENKNGGFLKGLQLTESYTFSHFRFAGYSTAENDFSGNRLTGVPQHVLVSGVTAHLPAGLILTAQYTFTGKIPLNDANTFYAKRYRLLQAKLRWEGIKTGTYAVTAYAGADNLLNETYSLGHDINAFGNRFYNAAPPLNFYAGLNIRFL